MTPTPDSPTPPEDPELVARQGPGFAPVRGDDPLDPDPAVTTLHEGPVTIPGERTRPVTDPPSRDKPSPSSRTSARPSSRGSTPSVSPEEARAEREAANAMLTGMLGSAFELFGVAIHERLTPGDNDCWLPRPGERDLVAGALASMAGRHMPAGVGAASDLGDAITAGVGVALYTVNNAVRTFYGRRRGFREVREAEFAGPPSSPERSGPPGTPQPGGPDPGEFAEAPRPEDPPPRDPLLGL